MAGFKTSFFGFSKKDVTKFTTSLAAEYSAKLKEKDKEIDSLKLEIKELRKKTSELENKIEELENNEETLNGTDE